MNILRNFSLKNRLLFFPASLVAVTTLLLGLSAYVTYSYNDLLDHLHHEDIQILNLISGISSDFEYTNNQLLALFDQANSTPEEAYIEAAEHLDTLHNLQRRVTDISIEGHLSLEMAHADHFIDTQALQKAINNYLLTATSAMERYFYNPTSANEIIQDMLDQSAEVNHFLTDLTKITVNQIEHEIHEEAGHAGLITAILLLLASATAIITVLINTGVARKVDRSLNSIRKSLTGLADGELNVHLPFEEGMPEINEMSKALEAYKSTQIELRNTLQELSAIKSDLETRVNQRTAELQESNHKLLHEITQNLISQEQLKIYKQALHSTSEAVIITSANNRILEVNDSYCEITGYSRDEIIGAPPSKFKSGQHPPEFYQEMWQKLNKHGRWKGEIWDRRKNGQVYPKWLTINTVVNEQEQITNYVGVFTDISDLKSKEAQLEKLAHFDPLTQLPNRMLCRERVEQKLLVARHKQTKVAILFIDLDRFKLINDSLGHAAGDQLLKTVAERLESSLRAEDLMYPLNSHFSHTIARLGGDEFIISLSDLNSVDYIADIVERLQETIRKPIHLCGREVSVDSSIGVAIYPDDGNTYETLSRHADTAMYRSKESGRGQFTLFTEEMNKQAHQRLQLEIEMKASIKEKHFELHFQPKVCTKSHKIQSFEALVRWNHPQLGLIPPNDFIEVAEETGMIIPLGEWILEEACRVCFELNRKFNKGLHVAVNISTRQFQDPKLQDKIAKALAKSGLLPEHLELEITESAIFGDIDEAINIIREIRDTGVHFALDDFGTGYSSLSYLKQLPVDTLKIDRSFIAQIDQAETDDDRKIVETMLLLGKQFRMKTVAEGVENKEQETFLSDLGCDLLQGYLYSKPLPEEEFCEYFSKSESLTAQKTA